MKSLLVLSALLVVGCLKVQPPLPPEPEIVIVESRRSHSTAEPVEAATTDAAPPIKTWRSHEEIQEEADQQAEHESDAKRFFQMRGPVQPNVNVRYHEPCTCIVGDFRCGCIN